MLWTFFTLIYHYHYQRCCLFKKYIFLFIFTSRVNRPLCYKLVTKWIYWVNNLLRHLDHARIHLLSRELKSVSLRTRWAHGGGPAGAESLSPDLTAVLLSAGVWLWVTSICHCVCPGGLHRNGPNTHTHTGLCVYAFISLLLRSLDSLMKQDYF